MGRQNLFLQFHVGTRRHAGGGYLLRLPGGALLAHLGELLSPPSAPFFLAIQGTGKCGAYGFRAALIHRRGAQTPMDLDLYACTRVRTSLTAARCCMGSWQRHRGGRGCRFRSSCLTTRIDLYGDRRVQELTLYVHACLCSQSTARPPDSHVERIRHQESARVRCLASREEFGGAFLQFFLCSVGALRAFSMRAPDSCELSREWARARTVWGRHQNLL